MEVEQPQTKKKPIKLSDLNDHCLMKIFQDFSKVDLLNIVECDSGVGNAARCVFKRKFGDEIFFVQNDYNNKSFGNTRDIKWLKYFGSVITKLYVSYNDAYRRMDMLLDNAIMTHCRKSLVEITFYNADSLTLWGNTEPFENVVKVQLVNSKFGLLIANFNKWLPKANTMALTNQARLDYNERKLIESNFPALKNIRISNINEQQTNRDPTKGKLNNYNVVIFLKFNPQLENVFITIDDYNEPVANGFDGIALDQQLLEILKYELKHLKCLTFSLTGVSPNMQNFEKVSFDKLKQLTINYVNSETLNVIPISANNIETLRMFGPFDVNCFNFIERYPSSVIIFDYRHNLFSLSSFSRILKTFKQLKLCVIKFNGGVPHNFVNLNVPGWNCTVEHDSFNKTEYKIIFERNN